MLGELKPKGPKGPAALALVVKGRVGDERQTMYSAFHGDSVMPLAFMNQRWCSWRLLLEGTERQDTGDVL